MNLDYDSPHFLRDFLAAQGFSMKKRFGQNFMISPSSRSKILALLPQDPNLRVWELGPGLGALTYQLLRTYNQVKVFEIDHGFVRILQEIFADSKGLSIVEGDGLKTWPEQAQIYGVPDILLGNLPYSTGSVMIAGFMEAQFLPPVMVFTLQREVAQRMISGPGRKEYSSFSVLCQTYYKVEIAGDLKPGAFYPAPEVTSTILRLTRLEQTQALPDPKIFAQVLRGSFASRRKTLQNNLRALQIPKPDAQGFYTWDEIASVARELDIDPGRRAEEFSPAAFRALALALGPRT